MKLSECEFCQNPLLQLSFTHKGGTFMAYI